MPEQPPSIDPTVQWADPIARAADPQPETLPPVSPIGEIELADVLEEQNASAVVR